MSWEDGEDVLVRPVLRRGKESRRKLLHRGWNILCRLACSYQLVGGGRGKASARKERPSLEYGEKVVSLTQGRNDHGSLSLTPQHPNTRTQTPCPSFFATSLVRNIISYLVDDLLWGSLAKEEKKKRSNEASLADVRRRGKERLSPNLEV